MTLQNFCLFFNRWNKLRSSFPLLIFSLFCAEADEPDLTLSTFCLEISLDTNVLIFTDHFLVPSQAGFTSAPYFDSSLLEAWSFSSRGRILQISSRMICCVVRLIKWNFEFYMSSYSNWDTGGNALLCCWKLSLLLLEISTTFFFEPFERDRGASISVHYISQLKQGSMDVVAEIVNFPCPEISVFALSTFCRGIRRF